MDGLRVARALQNGWYLLKCFKLPLPNLSPHTPAKTLFGPHVHACRRPSWPLLSKNVKIFEGQQRHISICEGCFCSLTKLLQSWQRMPANAISSLPKCNWSKALLWQTPEINPVKKYRKYPPASFFDVWVFHFFVCCHGYFVKRGKRLGKWSRKLQFWLIVHIGDRKHSCSAFLERKSLSIRKFDFSSP